MDANPTATKEEYDHHCKELARELQLARDSLQDVAAEQERVSAKNALEERVNNLTAIYEVCMHPWIVVVVVEVKPTRETNHPTL